MAGWHRALVVVVLVALLVGGSLGGPSRAGPRMGWEDCPGLRLNEFLPQPLNVDWDGDGTVGPKDEWIELYNASDTPCDLNGWALDDEVGAGSQPFVITQTTIVASQGYIVFYRRQTGVQLDTVDWVRLLRPGDQYPFDTFPYSWSWPDLSYSRTDSGIWEADTPPTPGRANGWHRRYLPLVLSGQ